ncbi:unnamed protein product, partial [Linum tenue]
FGELISHACLNRYQEELHGFGVARSRPGEPGGVTGWLTRSEEWNSWLLNGFEKQRAFARRDIFTEWLLVWYNGGLMASGFWEQARNIMSWRCCFICPPCYIAFHLPPPPPPPPIAIHLLYCHLDLAIAVVLHPGSYYGVLLNSMIFCHFDLKTCV